MKQFIPFALPSIGEEEEQEVVDTLRSGWLTTGPKTAKFETLFSEYIGAKNALAVNSATSGLHLALDAVGVTAGDKVITTPYTFTATAEVIRYLNADPIFVDIDPFTFNIDPKKISEAVEINDNIKVILPVHFAGQSCEMDKIHEIAAQNDIAVVEDAAHALPTTWKRQTIGTLSDITVYSFYVTKTIATGEGGMVVTNNRSYYERMRTMRLHGINRDVFDRYTSDKPSWFYEVVAPGYKYNLTDIAASIGIHQLKKVESFQQRREWIAKQYNSAFDCLPLQRPYVAKPDDLHSWHLYVIQLELESIRITRNRFIELMAEEGIGTSVHFIPLHLHPYWRDRYGYQPEDFPAALEAFKRSVSLPIYPKMSDDDVSHVINSVITILESNRK